MYKIKNISDSVRKFRLCGQDIVLGPGGEYESKFKLDLPTEFFEVIETNKKEEVEEIVLEQSNEEINE